MAITGVNNTAGNTDGTGAPYSTASVTPTANRLYLLSFTVRNTTASIADPSSVTGMGLTWVQVSRLRYDAASAFRDAFVYRALGASPTSGAISINFASAQTSCSWSVDEFDSIDTSGTNGSGAIVQTTSSTTTVGTGPTTNTTTLAAFSSVNNATFGAGFISDTPALYGTATVASGYTQLGKSEPTTNGNATLTQWRADNSTSVGNSTTNNSAERGIIGIELKMAATISAALTGTATASITEADIVAGGKTIIQTLSGDTWITS